MARIVVSDEFMWRFKRLKTVFANSASSKFNAATYSLSGSVSIVRYIQSDSVRENAISLSTPTSAQGSVERGPTICFQTGGQFGWPLKIIFGWFRSCIFQVAGLAFKLYAIHTNLVGPALDDFMEFLGIHDDTSPLAQNNFFTVELV